ncbi:conserved hypothetical protein [Cupriavidus taiwanensis]|uniref:Uncharacterized protein n=1 Tax=Cupriavidus taiwanensis TaxID=164546 RepID=A0A375BG70_9BURK|nr:conserved hypothetical protein [Cupriavidus taiwanensis]
MRFNRESACRGIGENPRIKNRAALPIARVKQSRGRRRRMGAQKQKAGSKASGFSEFAGGA